MQIQRPIRNTLCAIFTILLLSCSGAGLRNSSDNKVKSDGNSDTESDTASKTCRPLNAAGVGACDAVLGTIWNGTSCEEISGCGCAGSDCGAIMTEESCQANFADCMQ